MTPTSPPQAVNRMPYRVRPLRETDIHQSAEIESDAFPTLFPRTSFRRELKNRTAEYLVAVERSNGVPGRLRQVGHAHTGPGRPVFGSFLRKALGRQERTPPSDGDFIAGFVGSWYMAEEAHVVSVGVRSECRGRGIGELLLIAAIEQATARNAEVVTLEVRPSNAVARNLYTKYGFEERGIRKGYYADDREDAIIMTTGPLQSLSQVERFEELKRQHQLRWGQAELRLA